jgi:serine phosphatase RsbU (regulator of sigma subunit)/putative methionine-R-sulfoxide reductase with GAF domain
MSLDINDLKAILDINSKINSIDDVTTVLRDISHYAGILLNAEGASILLVDPENGNLHFEVVYGENADALYDMVVPKGKGIAGYVADKMESVIVNDTAKDPRWYKDVDDVTKLSTKTLLAVPLVHQGASIGVIEVINARSGSFTQDDVTLINHFAQQAAIAISNSLMYRELNDRANELEILYQISNLTNLTYDRKELFDRIVQLLSKAFHSERVSIMFVDEMTGSLYVESALGISDEIAREIQNELNSNRISSRVLHLGKVIFANDIEREGIGRNKRFRYTRGGFISVPVKVKNIPIGVINLSEPTEEVHYSTEIIKILQTIANQVGHTYEGILSYQEKIEHEKIRKEVDIMRTLQNALLISDFRDYRNVSIFARMKPAEIVGGDFYDIYKFTPSRLGFVIGDVSGKGLPASLFMAVSRSVIKAYAFQTKDPHKILEYANTILVDDSRVGMFVTVFFGVIDTEKGILEYSNGGHNLQYLYRPRTDEFLPLVSRGIPLGISQVETYETNSVAVESGDVIITFTDGLLEANNKEGEEFGIQRIHKVVRENAALNAATLVNALYRESDKWSEDTAQWDDITIVGIKVP